MQNFSRIVCLLLVFLWSSVPGRDHLLMGGEDGLLCPGPICPMLVPEPPPVKVPVLSAPDPPAPVVTIKVRVPHCIVPEQDLEYHIFVENCSLLPAHNVLVRNLLPANARFVRASPEPHKTDPELQWNLGTLAGRACKEIVLILAPTGPNDITNCTRVQFEHGQCVTTHLAGAGPPGFPPKITPLPEKEPPTKEPPVVSLAKLKLTVDGPDKGTVGQPARYQITVANQGTATATNVLIDANLLKKLSFVSASDKGEFLAAEGNVAWLLGDLAIGASKTVELVVRAKDAGLICFKTRALADKGVTAEAEKCTTFAGVPPSALLLEMYDRDDPIPLGGNTSYPIFVVNQGQVPVTNLRIVADLPDGMDLARARGPVDHKIKGKSVAFEPVPSLEPGAKLEFEVYTRAVAVGDLRFRIQMTADQLERGPVHEEESTTVYDEDAPPVRIQMQSGKRRQRVILLDVE